MIFIWGSRYLSSTKDTGRFYCPKCGKVDVGYRHQSARQWFTMYFIPVFPIGGRTEHIECTRCQTAFELAVLDLKPPTEDALFLNDCFVRLQRGRSLESVEADLVESGRTADQAVGVIDEMTRGKVWECDRCNAHYLKGVRKCRECEGLRELPARNVQL